MGNEQAKGGTPTWGTVSRRGRRGSARGEGVVLGGFGYSVFGGVKEIGGEWA